MFGYGIIFTALFFLAVFLHVFALHMLDERDFNFSEAMALGIGEYLALTLAFVPLHKAVMG